MAAPSDDSGEVEDDEDDTVVTVDLDLCSRLVLNKDNTLLRIIKGPHDIRHAPALRDLRKMYGRILREVHGVRLGDKHTLTAVTQAYKFRKGADSDEQLELTFSPPTPTKEWHLQSSPEKQRQEANNLYPPDKLETVASARVLLDHQRQSKGSRRTVIRELSAIPAGSRFYFNHPWWKLYDLGALLELPPRSLRELDLSNNALTEVGPALSRFDHLVDLRLDNNQLKSIELHYLPRLKLLSLAFNQLQVLPELLGLPSLQELDLCDNKIGSRRTLSDGLLKPTGGSSGKGIGVGGSLDALERHYAAESGGGGGGAWVVQKYVERPLLYRGRKFDVRVFALLASDKSETWSTDLGFTLHAHREGYGRTSSEAFSLSTLHDRAQHLTNYAVQKGAKHAGKHERGNCVSFRDLDDALGPAVAFRQRVVPAMYALIADAVLAARSELLDTLHAAKAPSSAFKTLLAFDLIVEEGADGGAPPTPLLLEINPYPGMEPQSDWHGKYFARLLDDYVGRCVGDLQHHDFGRPVLDGHHVPNYRDDGWELLLGPTADAGGAEGGSAGGRPMFDVVPCGSRLVRKRT